MVFKRLKWNKLIGARKPVGYHKFKLVFQFLKIKYKVPFCCHTWRYVYMGDIFPLKNQ